VLWFDLRERAMLGDAGANLLGFTVGLGLYLALPGWGVAAASTAVAALNVVAETVSLTRVIAAVPPLRWLDRLGRA
jgi:UDP-GlcNAc:undecaprenyl-phosphate/decaprenyl-phosphate GlcNAc-1-phosphate transferase